MNKSYVAKILSCIAMVGIIIVLLFSITKIIVPSNKYKEAEKMFASNDFVGAAELFSELGAYKDAKDKCLESWGNIVNRETLSAGCFHTVGLKSDGTVIAAGDNDDGQCNVSAWADIVAICTGDWHTVGLKSNGTVVATGNNEDGQCEVSTWSDIVAISAGYYHTVGLKSDGTVVATGDNNDGQCAVSSWTDVIAIGTGSYHTVGLKSDGTVVSTGNNDYGQRNVSSWSDVVAITAQHIHTVALMSDGTVRATGYEGRGRCDVSTWSDIVAIDAGDSYTVGLKSDGTVLAVGGNFYGECDVSTWSDVVAINAGFGHTVGLKADGTVIGTGRCDVPAWTDIKLPNSIAFRADLDKLFEQTDERDTDIQQSKQNLQPYLEVMGTDTGDGALDVSQNFIDNRTSVNLMGYSGTIEHGYTEPNGSVIDIMDWVSNSQVAGSDFESFINELTLYFGHEPTQKSYSNLSDKTHVWVDYDELCMVCCWNENGRAYVRWYLEEELILSESKLALTPKPTETDRPITPPSSTTKPKTNESKAKCEECGKTATKSIELFGQTEYYCTTHYNEVMDIIDMMETDVGKGTASKHTCEECSKEGTRTYHSFTGQTEYYCTQHYQELMDMLDAFGLS